VPRHHRRPTAREIRLDARREPANTFTPQEHLPGRESEVDFGEVAVRLRGELVTCTQFRLRLCYSGKAVHRISASAGQEAFFEGHTHAFRVLGGVPTGKLRYDNLKAAVASVIGFSRQHVEADRWTASRSHYSIEGQLGIQGAHEKGGVEGREIGRAFDASGPPAPLSNLTSFSGELGRNRHIGGARDCVVR